MKTKLTKKEYIFLSSMLFGLFFGAGNLIFPASMGQLAGSASLPAIIGFCLTGVGLPLLGIAAMGISESEGLLAMSSKVGKAYGYFFTCALYLCIGPFFAIPRTATVSFEVGIAPLLSEKQLSLALLLFTFLFFLIVLFFSLKPSGILTWVGKILNPLFLLFLGILILSAVIHPMGSISVAAPIGDYATHSFFTGFLEGYNTMDALAGLAFGIVLINVIRGLGITNPSRITISTILSGIFSMLIMIIIYYSLTMIGAQSRTVLGICEDGGAVLYGISKYYFGSFGGIFLGITITFACLKTSIGLVTSCATTFVEMFPKTFSYKAYTIIFSLFSFGIANVGLSRIIAYSLPALMFLYPLTIMLILLCLFGRLFHYRQCVFVSSMIATGLAAFLDFFHTLPTNIQGIIPLHALLTSAQAALPFSSIGMGWVVPAAIGLITGLLLMLRRK